MKKIFTIASCFLLLLCLVGCANLFGEKKGDVQQSSYQITSQRYEPVSAQSNSSPLVVYSATDTEYNYYVILLGHVNLVPIASGTAYGYDGVTSINLTFSKSAVTTNSIQQSAANCVSQSTALNASFGTSMEIGASIESSVPGVAKAAASVKAGITASISRNLSYSCSTTDTFTTAQSEANTLQESLSFTIGNKGEKAGKYRLALFATTDIYLCVQLDIENYTVISSTTAVCARPETYTYMIDYDSDPSGTFKKTSTNDLLNISADFYKSLAKPTERIDTSGSIIGDVTPTVTTYTLAFSPISCKHDNGFNPNEKNTSNLENSEVNSNVVAVLVNGCYRQDGKYTIGDELELGLKFLQSGGTNGIQINSASGSSLKAAAISNDDTKKGVYETDIGNIAIGKGAFFVRVTYTDQSSQTGNKINFMDGKIKSDYVNILSDAGISINTGKKILKIDIVVAYEIKGDWQGALGVWKSTYTDWRCETTLNFN